MESCVDQRSASHDDVSAVPPRRHGSSKRMLHKARLTVLAAPLAAIVLFVLLLAVTPSATDASDRAAAQLAEHRATTALTKIPARLATAVLATEDHRFYAHHGLDPIALVRTGNGLLHGRDDGGATIEAQLAKLLYTGARDDWTAQVDRAGLAIKLDQSYSKDQILLMYLNVAYFGHGFFGANAASAGYFGRSPADLDWNQAALLAGLLQDPTGYDPLTHPQAARQRRHHVLDRLATTGSLTVADAARYDGLGLELSAH